MKQMHNAYPGMITLPHFDEIQNNYNSIKGIGRNTARGAGVRK